MKTLPLILSAIAVLGCSKQVPELRYVVPRGYRGTLVMSESATAPTLEELGWRVTFNKSGQAEVKSLDPLTDWHKTSASYDDGALISDGMTAHSSPDEIIFRHLGVDRRKRDEVLFIGTMKEFEAAEDLFYRTR